MERRSVQNHTAPIDLEVKISTYGLALRGILHPKSLDSCEKPTSSFRVQIGSPWFTYFLRSEPSWLKSGPWGWRLHNYRTHYLPSWLSSSTSNEFRPPHRSGHRLLLSVGLLLWTIPHLVWVSLKLENLDFLLKECSPITISLYYFLLLLVSAYYITSNITIYISKYFKIHSYLSFPPIYYSP